MSIGQRIKCVCKERGMTVKELDKLAFPNTKGQTIGRWEENRPSIDKVVTVAQILNVSVDYLVGLTDEKKPVPTDGNELNDREKLVLRLFKRLPAANQESVIAQLQGLVQFQEAQDARSKSE